MAVRDDLHHETRPRRVFRSAGALSAERDLAARSVDILRTEVGEVERIA